MTSIAQLLDDLIDQIEQLQRGLVDLENAYDREPSGTGTGTGTDCSTTSSMCRVTAPKAPHPPVEVPEDA